MVYKSKIDVDFVKIEIDIELVNQLIFGFKKNNGMMTRTIRTLKRLLGALFCVVVRAV